MDFLRYLIEQDRAWLIAMTDFVLARGWLIAPVQFCATWLIFCMGGIALLSLKPVREAAESQSGEAARPQREWLFPHGMPAGRETESPVFTRVCDGFPTLAAVASAGIGYLLRMMVAHIIVRARPLEAGDVIRPFITTPDSASFPSGHATAAFAIAFAVLPDRPVLGTVLLFAAALVSAGRVMAGVHYPLDVVGGAVLGALTAGALRLALGKLRSHARVTLSLKAKAEG